MAQHRGRLLAGPLQGRRRQIWPDRIGDQRVAACDDRYRDAVVDLAADDLRPDRSPAFTADWLLDSIHPVNRGCPTFIRSLQDARQWTKLVGAVQAAIIGLYLRAMPSDFPLRRSASLRSPDGNLRQRGETGMTSVLASVREVRLLALLVLAVATLAACGGNERREDIQTTATQAASGTLSLRAGLNDPKDQNIAILEYLPEVVTMARGAKVEWQFAGPEPHSVTFFPRGQNPPPPGSDPKLFEPTPPKEPYDGTTLVNSGLRPQGPRPGASFQVSFDTPGTYRYHCVIHPFMTGTVTVAEQAGEADPQSQITAGGDEEVSRWLAEGRAAKERLTEMPAKRIKNSDGATTWRVEMGTTTEHTDVLAFAPLATKIKAADRVVFVNNSGAPHTATFAGRQRLPTDPESPKVMKPAPGPAPQRLNPTNYFNTGWLPPNAPPGAGPPKRARSFTFIVPVAGTYTYVCVLHVPSGMTGTIRVR
jgi:plastocyanin